MVHNGPKWSWINVIVPNAILRHNLYDYDISTDPCLDGSSRLYKDYLSENLFHALLCGWGFKIILHPVMFISGLLRQSLVTSLEEVVALGGTAIFKPVAVFLKNNWKSQIVPNSSKLSQIVLNGLKWFQWFQMVPNGVK